MSEAFAKEPSRLQTLLSEKLRITPKQESTKPVDVQMPASLHSQTVRLANEMNMSHASVLEMLFAKMRLSLDVTLDAIVLANNTKREIAETQERHKKFVHAANVHTQAVIGRDMA